MAELTLPHDPASVGAARRWIGSRLDGWSEEGRSAATLVVSELVANVVLHARTDCRVALHLEGDCCRITVADGDPHGPAVKHYGDDAPTGRGLRLVGRLSSDWGIDRLADGKEVWAVLYDRPWAVDRLLGRGPARDDTTAPAPAQPADPSWDGFIEILLIRVPPSVILEAQEHNDELMREFAFLSGSRHLSSRLESLAREVEDHFGPVADGIRTEVETAAAGGRPAVDLRVRMSRDGWLALRGLSELLDQTDDYCERAELLTLASSPSVRRFRHWYTTEVARQMAGGLPSPCPVQVP